MADLSTYKVNLDTPQPNGRQGESPRSAFTKYNNLVDGLGTAATADVTTSPTDTTADRLLKVGDYGLGKDFRIADYDVHLPQGFFEGTSTTLNNPIPNITMNGVQGINLTWGPDHNVRIMSRYNSDNLYYQRRHSGVLQNLNEIYHTGKKIETNFMPEVDGDPLIKAKDAAKLSGGADANFTNMPRVGGDDLIKYKDSFATNQGWVDVKSSRSVNTNYTNTTGKPLAVLISMDHPSSSAYNQSNMIVDGAIAGVVFHTSGGLRIIHPIFVIVPNGRSYKLEVQGTDAPTVYTWHEYR